MRQHTSRSHKTVTELLCPDLDKSFQRRVEEHRKKWEKLNGPTDIAIRYTSQLPAEKQARLLQKSPENYFNGLPPYFQDYLRQSLDQSFDDGTLRDHPAALVGIYLNGRIRGSRLSR